jgi:hypothetical protein
MRGNQTRESSTNGIGFRNHFSIPQKHGTDTWLSSFQSLKRFWGTFRCSRGGAWVKATILLGIAMMAVVRTPHMKRAGTIRVVAKRQGKLYNALVALVSIGLFLPVVLAFVDYSPRPTVFGLGVLTLTAGLWFLHRSHVELGDELV